MLQAQRLRFPPAPPERVAADGPVQMPDPNFPLRVHLVVARFGGTGGRYHGYGSGNLMEAGAATGFDYGFECSVPFIANQVAEETYQARWTEQPYRLEILTTEIGGNQPREHACTLRLAMRQRPFVRANSVMQTHGVSSSLRVRWEDPEFAYQERDAEYPMQFHVVDAERSEDAYADHGWGTGNLIDPIDPGAQSTIEGVEYHYDCARGFLGNLQVEEFYQARWLTPGSKMEVLLARPGTGKVDRCTVEVVQQPQPYPLLGVGSGAQTASSSGAAENR